MPLIMGISDRIFALAAGVDPRRGHARGDPGQPRGRRGYLGGHVDIERVASDGRERTTDVAARRRAALSRASYGARPRCCAGHRPHACARGEIVALLGTNGAGKSTILRCISGLMQADAGAIRFEGDDITGMPARGDGAARHHPGARRPGPAAQPHVEENLRMGAYPIRKDKAARRRRLRPRLRDLPPARRAAPAAGRARCRAASSRCSPSAGR